MGVFDIETMKMMEGDLPPKALSMVQEWAGQYKVELLKIWKTQQFVSLPPLE